MIKRKAVIVSESPAGPDHRALQFANGLTFDTSEIAPVLMAEVLAYGTKQIINDAAASAVTDAGKKVAMQECIAALRDGTKAFRSGAAGGGGGESAAMFGALVRAGVITDSAEARAAWAAATPAERRGVFARFPEAAQYMPRPTPAVAEGLLSKLGLA